MLPISVLQGLSTRMVPGGSDRALRPLISNVGPNTWTHPQWVIPPQAAAQNVNFDVATDGTWVKFTGTTSYTVKDSLAVATTSGPLNWQEDGGATTSDGLVVYVNTTYTDQKIYSIAIDTEISAGNLAVEHASWESNITLSDPTLYTTDETGTWFMLPYDGFQLVSGPNGYDSSAIKMSKGALKTTLSIKCKSWYGLQPGDFSLELNKIARFVYGK